jgi:hypothetical protein
MIANEPVEVPAEKISIERHKEFVRWQAGEPQEFTTRVMVVLPIFHVATESLPGLPRTTCSKRLGAKSSTSGRDGPFEITTFQDEKSSF